MKMKIVVPCLADGRQMTIVEFVIDSHGVLYLYGACVRRDTGA